MTTTRRFPPPWSVGDIGAAFVVMDSGGQKLAYIYYEEEPGRRSAATMLSKDEARRDGFGCLSEPCTQCKIGKIKFAISMMAWFPTHGAPEGISKSFR